MVIFPITSRIFQCNTFDLKRNRFDDFVYGFKFIFKSALYSSTEVRLDTANQFIKMIGFIWKKLD